MIENHPAAVVSRLRRALLALRVPTASLVRLVPAKGDQPPAVDLGALRPAAARRLAFALDQAPTAPGSTASADH